MASATVSSANMLSALAYSRQPARREEWLRELEILLAFPSISTLAARRRDLAAAAHWLKRHLEGLGLYHAQVLPGIEGGAPSVYADWLLAPGRPTLLLYGHYDVVPVDPLSEWHTPPFQAIRSGQNLFARGASDDKGQFFIHLKAVESYLETVGRLPLNVKVWLEGEEEMGSPHLAAFLAREASRLRADAVLVSDTAMVDEGHPSLIYGLRGALACELEVVGPRHDLHSGRYGGAVLSPLQALCDILAKLHDATGRVAIPGFYNRVRSVAPMERQELTCGAPSDEVLVDDLDILAGWGEQGYSMFERMTIRPALTINGLHGGYIGPGSKGVIPKRSMAHFSLRLVPDQEPAEVALLLQQHIAALKPPQVDIRLRVTGGVSPVIVPRRHPVLQAAARAIHNTWRVSPVFTRSGGSIPLVTHMQLHFDVPVVLLGFGLPDDDVHAPNEKLYLPNFFRGIETIIRFFAEYGS